MKYCTNVFKFDSDSSTNNWALVQLIEIGICISFYIGIYAISTHMDTLHKICPRLRTSAGRWLCHRFRGIA